MDSRFHDASRFRLRDLILAPNFSRIDAVDARDGLDNDLALLKTFRMKTGFFGSEVEHVRLAFPPAGWLLSGGVTTVSVDVPERDGPDPCRSWC